MKGRSLHTKHICTFDAQLNLASACGLVLTSIPCTQHISFCAISTDPNPNNKWQSIHGHSNEGCSAHSSHICMFHASINLEYMCGAVVASNICVHQNTWVCRHQHCTGARRRQIRLERIRHTWSKTKGRKYDRSWIEQSRRIENWLVRLRPQKSSKFWKLETRLQTPQ